MKYASFSHRSHRWISVILLAFFLLAGAAPALANTQGIIRNPNGGTYVNVRSWPSYDADILTSLGVGSTVEITGTNGSWYTVWVNGVVGYINSNFVAIGSTGGTDASATVRSGPLNVREAPSMRARVITQFPTGLRITVLDRQGTWTQVQAAQVIGYVMSSYLVFDNDSSSTAPPVTTENANATIKTLNGGSLNLRSWASSSAPIVNAYANGSRIRVITQEGAWYRVQAGYDYGYMSSIYVVIDGSGGSTGTSYDGLVSNPGAHQKLNLRRLPSTDSASLGQYANGTPVAILGAGTEWLRVTVGGVEGYMMSQYVRITNTAITPHKTITGGSGFVNLRSGPGYGYSVLSQLSNGTAASVVTPYPEWSEILVRQGTGYQRGYILNSFLK